MSREITAVEPVRAELRPPQPARQLPPPGVEERPVELLGTLVRSGLLVALVTLAFVAAGAAYVLIATPVFQADTVVQVEQTGRNTTGLPELSAAPSERSSADTELEILRSRSLLGPVVDQLRLGIVAAPRTFPGLGFLARLRDGAAPASPLLGLSSYAWGGERIAVEQLDVPAALLDRTLELTATGDGGYVLSGPGGERLLEGRVGAVASGTSAGGPVRLLVSELVARPATRFRVTRQSRARAIAALQQRLRVSEKGRNTGVLVISLTSPDPARAERILDAIADTYVRQNVEHRSAEAAKALEFVESQLPKVRANVEGAESARASDQARRGTVDLSRESQALLDRSVAVERALSEAELQRPDLRQRFTANHPALVALDQKIETLRRERAAIDARMRTLPGSEVVATRLERDVKVSTDLYDLLLNKAQELRLLKSGTIGTVRVVDPASASDRPVSPDAKMALALSALFGLTAGGGIALGRRALRSGIEDPDGLERATGLPVYTSVPRSLQERRLRRGRARSIRPTVLAAVAPTDPAVEALRVLRATLELALREDGTDNVVVVTSPTAGDGKSFVTTNLAQLLAASGKRVLVVDADLRRGGLHRSFGSARAPGLSDVLAGTIPSGDAIRKAADGLDWLPTGHIPANPAEALSGDQLQHLVTDLSARYDVVLLDTAPVLPVADAAVVARHAGTTLLVLGAGVHPMPEVHAALKRLTHAGVAVRGFVLNDLSGVRSPDARYGYRYQHDAK